MPNFLYRVLIVVGAIALFAGCTATESESSQTASLSSSFSDLPAGWNIIRPGGDTGCSDGSDYAFQVRAGDPDKLLVYLQGGGACWNLRTCDPLLDPTYSIRAGDTVPQRYDGIFNYERNDNPFKDHTVVFAPYCSADVHMGDAQQTYTRDAAQKEKIRANGKHNGDIPDTFTVTHRGFANVGAVLAWTADNVVAPAEVFVTGSSAGSIPSPYYAMHIARMYPDAQITQLGDGAGGYRRMNQQSNPNLAWKTIEQLRTEPGFRDLTNDNFNYEQLYIRAATVAPSISFAAYDAAEDDVQKRFLTLGGVQMPSLLQALNANQADIRAAVPAFRSYIAGGDSHTILARPEFYSFTVGERSVRDWVANLAAGKPVADISCQACEAAETVVGQ